MSVAGHHRLYWVEGVYVIQGILGHNRLKIKFQPTLQLEMMKELLLARAKAAALLATRRLHQVLLAR